MVVRYIHRYADHTAATFWQDAEFSDARLFLFQYRGDLFEGKDEHDRQLQGTYPVIFLSFADVKEKDYQLARASIIGAIQNLFHSYLDLWHDSAEKAKRYSFMHIDKDTSDADIARPLQRLSSYLQYCKKRC